MSLLGLTDQACAPKMTTCWLYTLFLLDQVESEAQKCKREKGLWIMENLQSRGVPSYHFAGL